MQSVSATAILKQTNINTINAVLTGYNTQVYRPTLYDLLAHRALNYFKSDEAYITKPTYAFVINEHEALGNMEAFAEHKFVTKDTLSNKWKALLLLQELMRFHKARKDTAALIDVNLERIEFAKMNGTIQNEDSAYYEAVKETAERFAKSRYAAQAWYLMAQWHAEKANSYNANTDTIYRWENVKALAICKNFIPLTDSTEGHYNLFNLYNTIVAQVLETQMEQVNVPNLPFRTLVTYKNTGKVYYRVIAATKALEDSLEKNKVRFGWDGIAGSFPYIRQEEVLLPATNDHQNHSAEIKVSGLPSG